MSWKMDRRVAFVGLDLGRFLGWLPHVANPVVVCRDTLGLEEGLGCPVLEIPATEEETGTLSLLEDPQTAAFLESHRVQDLIVFKPSHRVAKWAEERGLRLLCGDVSIAQRIENKVRFAESAQEAGLPLPPLRLGSGPLPSWEDISEELGENLVVQGARGHSGHGTIRVTNAEEWNTLSARRGAWKISSLMPGHTLTFNGCIGSQGSFVLGPIYRQRTGDPRCTSIPLGACGNIWEDVDQSPEMMHVISRLSQWLSEQGYVGVFGVDLLWDEQTGLVTVIEVNPRLTSGLSMESLLQRSGLPILAQHLHATSGQPLSDVPIRLDSGSQAVLYQRENNPQKCAHTLRSGRFRWEDGNPLWLDTSSDPQDCEEGEAIVLVRTSDQWIGPLGEVARVQVLGGEKELSPWIDWLSSSLF